DGNNILEVYHAIRQISESLRKNPRPFLLECVSFRMRGHEEASGTKYYPDGIQAEWEKKDPVTNYELYLLNEEILTDKKVEKIKEEIRQEIHDELEIAFAEPKVIPNTQYELNDVYTPYKQVIIQPDLSKVTEKRFVDAISDGLKLSLKKYDDLV